MVKGNGMKRDYKIRRMNRDELDIAVDWAAKEGWNPGLADADCFYRMDPKGFFMGFLGSKPISSISAVAYDKKFGFLGFYIVKPEFRGKRYGIKIWKEAMKYLGIRNIGLDGVVDQQPNYKKSGFKLAYRNIRYQGVGSGEEYENADIVELSEVSFDDLRAYDDRLFPASRPQFLKCWISRAQSSAYGVLVKAKLVGYGVIRKCRKGYKIGPLFADSASLAENLFQAMSASVKKNEPIFLDVPEKNKTAVTLAKRHKMKVVFETARMYTKSEPEIDVNKVFGVTSFELG